MKTNYSNLFGLFLLFMKKAEHHHGGDCCCSVCESSIRLFKDGSGRIVDGQNIEVLSFDSFDDGVNLLDDTEEVAHIVKYLNDKYKDEIDESF